MKIHNKHEVRNQISQLTVNYKSILSYLADCRSKKKDYNIMMRGFYHRINDNLSKNDYINPDYIRYRNLYIDEKDREKYYVTQLKNIKKELRRLNTVLNKKSYYL